MATSVVKLTIDSQEYDAKLKSAGKALNEYFDIAKKGDRTFEVLDEGVLDAVRAIGQMETRSKSASGQLREMESVFTDMSVIYKRLSDEEKSAPIGQEMSKSLAELKERIAESKRNISDVREELGNTSSASKNAGNILETLSDKFGMSTKQVAGFGTAIAAAKVALDVAKDAFFQSESNIDEWGRTVEGAQGAYGVFLDTINGGNWSNFFSNIATAVQGSRDLYDALDRLGSVKANNQSAIAIEQQNISQLRLAKQQGAQVDAQIKEATERLATLQAQSVGAGKAAGRMMISETIRNAYNTQSGANPISQGSIDRAVTELISEGQKAFDKYSNIYQRLAEKAEDTRYATYGSSITGGQQTVQERYTNLGKLTDEERKQYLLSKAITESETRIQSGISTYAQAVQEGTGNAREQFKNNRYAMQGAGGGKKSNQENAQDKFDQAQKDYQQALEQAALEVKAGTADTVAAKKKELSAAESLWKSIGDAREVYDTPKFADAQKQAADKVVELGGSVNNLVESQKKSQEAARQLEQAEKDLAAAEKNLADTMTKNDLKSRNAAQADVDKARMALESVRTGTISSGVKKTEEVEVPITYTDANMQEFLSDLKQKIAVSDVGGELQRSLQVQFADANALANLMQTAIKNGIDITQFNPQELWSKVFGQDPGDYIDDATWKDIEDKINAKLKELKLNPIKLDVSTGNVQSQKEHKRNDDQYLKSFTEPMNTMTHDLSSISSSLKTLGLDVPEGVDKMLGGMQAITTILTAIQSLISLSNATSGLNSIPIIGGIASLFVGLFTGFNKGGIVPHAANGYYVPGTHYSGDMTPIMANAGELVLNASSERNLADAIKNAQSLVGSINDIYIADTTAIGSRQNRDLSDDLCGASRSRDVNVSISSDNIKLTLRNGAQARGMTLGQYLGL